MMTVTVHYFAQLREKTDLSEEKLSLESLCCVEEVYDRLDLKYQFAFDKSLLRYAINDEYVDPSTLLKEGDQLVFIPPVAGG